MLPYDKHDKRAGAGPAGGFSRGKAVSILCVVAVILFLYRLHAVSERSVAQQLSLFTSGAVSPPSREEMGRAIWTTLHKVAATTPVEPSPEHQETLITFVRKPLHTPPPPTTSPHHPLHHLRCTP